MKYSDRRKNEHIISFVGRDYIEYRRPDGSTFVLRDRPRQFSPQNPPKETPSKIGPQENEVALPLYKRIVKGNDYRIETEYASYDRATVTSVGSGSVVLTFKRSIDWNVGDGESQWPGTYEPKTLDIVETVKLANITSIIAL